MATTTMQKEPKDNNNDDQHKNVFDMMSDAAKAESQACESVTMEAMRIVSLQADETEAQLQNKDLSDSDRSKLFEERAAIRRDAINLADSFNANSVIKVLGLASIFAGIFGIGYGFGRYMLRTA